MIQNRAPNDHPHNDKINTYYTGRADRQLWAEVSPLSPTHRAASSSWSFTQTSSYQVAAGLGSLGGTS